MKRKTQVLFIHGGMTFKNNKDYLNYLKHRTIRLNHEENWEDFFLGEKLGKNFHLIKPRMPCKENARYEEWKIHFQRYMPLLKNNVVLVGYSLGGVFLAKYLSENKFPKKIVSVYLVASPFDDTIYNEDLAGGFKLKKDLSLIEKNSKKVYIMFSKDDPVVPVSHAEKFKNKIPHAKVVIYNDKNGHFRVTRFPEIVKMIKKDVKGLKKD